MKTRLAAYPTPEDCREIRRRARLHGLSLSAFLVSAALGRKAGPAGPADEWWETLSPARRATVHRWLTAGRPSNVDETLLVALPFE